MDRQLRNGGLRPAQRFGARKAEPKRRANSPESRRQRELCKVLRVILGFNNGDRPDRDVVRGPKLAGRNLILAEHAAQHRSARQMISLCKVGRVGRDLKLHHRHRRNRRAIVRVIRVEHRVGELREFRVELVLHAGGKECETFDQTLDVGIGADVIVKRQTAGDLSIGAFELSAHFAKVP